MAVLPRGSVTSPTLIDLTIYEIQKNRTHTKNNQSKQTTPSISEKGALQANQPGHLKENDVSEALVSWKGL